MAKNKNTKSKLQQMASPPSGHASNVYAAFLGLNKQPNQQKEVILVLKYYQAEYECFSSWTPNELKAFSDFSRKLHQQTWEQIYKSGGSSGKKTGLGLTKHRDKSKLPQCNAIRNAISAEINFFELRVSKKARVHGFRLGSIFFLVWLDRNHQICPM